MTRKLTAEVEAALVSFRRTRAAIDRLSAPTEGGVYAIYLCRPKALAPFFGSPDGLIYLGLSKNLAGRDTGQHFTTDMSGSSTLRRSLGAILKERSGWNAIPRANGSSKRDSHNYKFLPESEAALTKWMRSNLEIGFYATAQYKNIEHELIQILRPLLNLTKWENPNRSEIRRLRSICAEEARVHRNRIANHSTRSRVERAPG